MMSRTSNHFKFSVLVVAGVLVWFAVILLLISAANGSPDVAQKPDPNDPTTATKVPAITALSAEQKSDFSALTADRQVMPSATRQILLNPSVDVDRYGLNLDLAASVSSPASDDPIWIIPGDETICLYITDPVDGGGTTCASTADAMAGKLTIALRPGPGKSGKVAMTGLVADGVDSAVLSSDEGATHSKLPVKGNLWGFKAENPDNVAVDSPNGKITVSAP